MRKILLITAFLIPALIFGQAVNKFQYNAEGKLHTSYTGEDNANYTFKAYYSNGQKSTLGHYKNGVKHGIWKTWDENGKLTAVSHYRNGEKTGKWIIKDEYEHTVFEISFSHNHMLSALRKDQHGQIIAKR